MMQRYVRDQSITRGTAYWRVTVQNDATLHSNTRGTAYWRVTVQNDATLHSTTRGTAYWRVTVQNDATLTWHRLLAGHCTE
jgi:hypothetical protein